MNWPPFSLFYFLYFFLIMWSSCDHFVIYCSCDVYCSVTSIVLWPIVQSDSIVPVMSIVLVTPLFSITISTSSLWPYSLRLDFLYRMVHRAIRVPFPHSSLVPSTQGICSKAPDCLSSYHLSSELIKSSLDLILRTLKPFTQCLGDNLTHIGWTSLLWHNKRCPLYHLFQCCLIQNHLET